MSKKLKKEIEEELKKEIEEETETETETEEETETDGTEEEETEEGETEEEVKENLKNFIQSETKSASAKALDAKLDKMAEELVSKFYAGVEAQRKTAVKGIKAKNSDQEVVRKWFNALMIRDVSTLRAIEKDYVNTDDNEEGGYLVPPMLVAEVARFTEQYGVSRRDMRYMPFSGAGNSRKYLHC